jgi:serine phosphatase RsbU (regulator of sigma subunit)
MQPLIQRSLDRAELVPTVRALTLLAIAVLLFAFAVSAFLVRNAITAAAGTQQALRHAQVARALTLRYQINEESGIRGYSATDSTLFLQPYVESTAHFAAALADLRSSLLRLDPHASLTAVKAQQRLNDAWQQTFAGPILHNAALGRSTNFQLRGKGIVDRFRAADALVQTILHNDEQQADRNLAALVQSILLSALALGGGLSIILAFFLVLTVRALDAARAQRQAYEEEKRTVDRLQEAFAQKTLPVFPTVRFDAVYVSASRQASIGGDWYDAFELPDKRILFSIGDVCGHGLEAAVVMSRVRQALLSIGLTNTDPATVLSLTNRVLNLQDAPMVTAICGYIHPATMAISYATAGHPAPILTETNGDATHLPAFGVPLSTLDHPEFRTFHARGGEGSLLVLYTDGAIEQTHDILGGEAALQAACASAARNHATQPAQFIYDAIFGDVAPVDDVAILTATFSIAR